jgi:hypothetical protein
VFCLENVDDSDFKIFIFISDKAGKVEILAAPLKDICHFYL